MAQFKKSHLKSTLKGAAWLSLAGFITKALSALYRVPLQNMMGDTGFYVYQQIYPLYGLGLSLSLSGLPNALAKHLASLRKLKTRQIFLCRYFFILLVTCLGIFTLLYFGSGLLAQAMGDMALRPGIQSASWFYLCAPLLLVLRAAYQSRLDFGPVALAQVIEQLVRVAIILVVAYTGVYRLHLDVYQVSRYTYHASWLAAIAACTLLGICLISHYGTRRLFLWQPATCPVVNESDCAWRAVYAHLIKDGLLLCLLSSLPIILQLIDALTIYESLQAYGLKAELAKALKGIYDRSQPLLQLGLVVTVALQANYLPQLAQASRQQQRRKFKVLCQAYVRLVSFASILLAAGLIAIMPELNHLLFHSRAGSLVLSAYMLLIPLISWVVACYNIQLIWRRYRYLSLGLFLLFVVKEGLNLLLIPYLSLGGAVLASLLALSLMLLLAYFTLPAQGRSHLFDWRFLAATAKLALYIIVGVRGSLWLLGLCLTASRLAAFFALMIGIPMGVLIALLYLKKQPILNAKEWATLPFGQLLLRLLNLE